MIVHPARRSSRATAPAPATRSAPSAGSYLPYVKEVLAILLIESALMPERVFSHWVVPAIAGLFVGFLALAWAVLNEAALSVALVYLVSPGLKIAELAMPAAHESLAWTFGWFLRIAIGVNAIFYFSIFALLAYLVDRRRPQNG